MLCMSYAYARVTFCCQYLFLLICNKKRYRLPVIAQTPSLLVCLAQSLRVTSPTQHVRNMTYIRMRDVQTLPICGARATSED